MAFQKAASLSGLGGDMNAVALGDLKLVLVRDGGAVRAFEGTCPHAQAPLEDGALCEGRIICPWHMGTFDARTGALLEPVAMRGLHRYAVQLQGDDVLVDTEPMPETPVERQADSRVFAIAGAGAAAAMAAVTLRQSGFGGRICMVGPEAEEPLDRTLLSKMALSDPAFDRSWLPLEVDAERIVAGVVALDGAARTMTLTNGETLRYDAALLATGSAPVPPPFPGDGKALTLRTLRDLDGILPHIEDGAPAVVIGTSFIGMEVAAALAQRGMKVTVVGEASLPFAPLFGDRVGRAVLALFESKGVQFRLKARVARVDADAVLLEDGERCPASLVVAGIGVKPVLGYAAGLTVAKDGGLVADAGLQVAPGLWVAGDIASPAGWPRIEHWRLALQHGRIAALGMLGRSTRYEGVPFFWSQMFDTVLHSLGQTAGAEDVVYEGDVEGFDFTAWYLKGGLVAGALVSGRDAVSARLSHVLRRPLTLAEARAA